MKKISNFIHTVQFDSKKRTGVVYAADHFEEVLKLFINSGLELIDFSNHYSTDLLLSDDQLINKIRLLVNNKKCLLVNLEIFIAPRLADEFLENLIRKMVAEEPLKAVILLFYSKLLYQKFALFYQNHIPTINHTLDFSENISTFIHDQD